MHTEKQLFNLVSKYQYDLKHDRRAECPIATQIIACCQELKHSQNKEPILVELDKLFNQWM